MNAVLKNVPHCGCKQIPLWNQRNNIKVIKDSKDITIVKGTEAEQICHGTHIADFGGSDINISYVTKCGNGMILVRHVIPSTNCRIMLLKRTNKNNIAMLVHSVEVALYPEHLIVSPDGKCCFLVGRMFDNSFSLHSYDIDLCKKDIRFIKDDSITFPLDCAQEGCYNNTSVLKMYSFPFAGSSVAITDTDLYIFIGWHLYIYKYGTYFYLADNICLYKASISWYSKFKCVGNGFIERLSGFFTIEKACVSTLNSNIIFITSLSSIYEYDIASCKCKLLYNNTLNGSPRFYCLKTILSDGKEFLVVFHLTSFSLLKRNNHGKLDLVSEWTLSDIMSRNELIRMSSCFVNQYSGLCFCSILCTNDGENPEDIVEDDTQLTLCFNIFSPLKQRMLFHNKDIVPQVMQSFCMVNYYTREVLTINDAGILHLYRFPFKSLSLKVLAAEAVLRHCCSSDMSMYDIPKGLGQYLLTRMNSI